ncbi:hypothetical protein ACS1U1_004718, partial [Escherichia coli]
RAGGNRPDGLNEPVTQHQYSFKIENPANKHERPHHKYL